MRALSIIAACTLACGSADAPGPAAPKGPTACARAADNMVQTMLDRLPRNETPPTEEADALRNLIRERCEQDGWSAEATRCLIAMKTTEDAAACAQHMTDVQQEALVREQARRASAKAPPAPPGAGSGAAPGAGSGSE